jgi:uncharacterized membrane protein
MDKHRLLMVIVLGAMLYTRAQIWAEPLYTVIDLGAWVPAAVNDSTTVAGTQSDETGPSPAVWANGARMRLGQRGGAMGLNAHGTMVGEVNNWPFRWDTSEWHYLPVPSWAVRGTAMAINDAGQATGSISSGSQQFAVRWQNENLVILAGGRRGNTINAHGDVGGQWADASGHTYAGVWDTNGTLYDLGSLDADSASIYAINDARQVAGTVIEPGRMRAFRGQLGVGIALLPLLDDFVQSRGLGIGPDGSVVGTATPQSGLPVGALWTPDGTMYDLNRLIDPASGWVLQSALAVNAHGQIVGHGTWNGQSRAFLLRPLDAGQGP